MYNIIYYYCWPRRAIIVIVLAMRVLTRELTGAKEDKRDSWLIRKQRGNFEEDRTGSRSVYRALLYRCTLYTNIHNIYIYIHSTHTHSSSTRDLVAAATGGWRGDGNWPLQSFGLWPGALLARDPQKPFRSTWFLSRASKATAIIYYIRTPRPPRKQDVREPLQPRPRYIILYYNTCSSVRACG
jgi:hypothetical protein